MALLAGTVLTDCYYIPQFIASGTKMLFENASAPTSWTKDTTYNNSSLRVINGTVGNGGSSAFTTILTSRSVSGTVASVQSGVSFNQNATGITIGQSSAVPGTTGSALGSYPPHSHSYTALGYSAGKQPGPNSRNDRTTSTVGSAGGGQQHSHSFTLGAHSHPFSDAQHNHSISESNHDHPVSSTAQDFQVYYRDVILATKD